MKKGIVSQTIQYIAVFFGVTALFVIILLLAQRVPRGLIRNHMAESADILCENPVFYNLQEGINSSKIDRYADSILLSIAYHLDEEPGLSGVMRTAYYAYEWKNENTNFRDSITEDLPATKEYLRYWHGSAALMRFLHVIWNVRTIYYFHAILLGALTLVLIILLWRRSLRIEAVCVLAALIAVGVWYVPYSLEYTWVFLLTLLFSILLVLIESGRPGKVSCILFMVFGMLTCYLDFLTTETLTLLFPLLLVVRMRRRRALAGDSGGMNSASKKTSVSASGPTSVAASARSSVAASDQTPLSETTPAALWCFALCACLAWGIGYVGVWVTKWLLASLVLKENVLPYVTGHVAERAGGIEGQPLWATLAGSIIRNVLCLFPLEYGSRIAILALLAIPLTAIICFSYHRKKICLSQIFLYLFLGLVPYLRYLAFLNHSWLHYFFTYRAQAASCLAVFFIIPEVAALPSSAAGEVQKGSYTKKRRKRK